MPTNGDNRPGGARGDGKRLETRCVDGLNRQEARHGYVFSCLPTDYLLDYMYGNHDERPQIPTPRRATVLITVTTIILNASSLLPSTITHHHVLMRQRVNRCPWPLPPLLWPRPTTIRGLETHMSRVFFFFPFYNVH